MCVLEWAVPDHGHGYRSVPSRLRLSVWVEKLIKSRSAGIGVPVRGVWEAGEDGDGEKV